MQRRMGEGSPSGAPWGEKTSGRAVWKAAGGKSSKGILNAQRGEIHFRCAHVTHETTRDVGLRQPNRTFLGDNWQVQSEVGRTPA
jgi:hypothetical protein